MIDDRKSPRLHRRGQGEFYFTIDWLLWNILK